MAFLFGDMALDSVRRELRSGATLFPVEPQVFDLLEFLIRNRARVVSRDDLLAAVWKGRIVSDSAIDARINAARRAIGDDGEQQRWIRTIARKGFRFIGIVTEQSPQDDRSPRPGCTANVDGSTPATPMPDGARHRADRPSLVVMPFDNLSGEADQYFVDGVVEEITSALSRVRDFFVIARQSAFTYKGRFVDVREIGRELGVTYVVEGTVRRGGDRLRISVQLVNAETRTQLWSDRYEGATTDVFDFQDQIAAQVAGAIHPAVRNAEIALAKLRPPTSIRAYDLVLQAYPKLWGHTAKDNEQAISILGQAISIDTTYGRAHALLAWCLAQHVVFLWSANPEQDRAYALRPPGRPRA